MSNLSIHPTQSNTQAGFIPHQTSENLTGHEGRLAVPGETGLGKPLTAGSLALYLVIEVLGSTAVTAQALPLDHNVRIRAKGTGKKGDVLVLATPGESNADAGKVRTLPETAGAYFSPGIAEEDWADGQLVLTRPLPRIHHVQSADSLTELTFTGGGATGPQVEALRDELLDILQTHGLVAPTEA